MLPLALVATLLSSGALSSQEAGETPLEPVAETLLPTATVTVLGDGFVAAPGVAPVRNEECATSQVGPIETAASLSPDTALIVDNRSCSDASLTTLASTQLQAVDAATSLVVIGGIGLEFDWPGLVTSCLDPELRSTSACLGEAGLARATAANSFFSWRSVIQQAHSAAPDATIVVLAPPVPVSNETLQLGSPCCGESTDGNAQVRGVFDTAGALRRAVAESLPEIPVLVVETDVAFEGHRMDDEVPWLGVEGVLAGLPNEFGVAALAALIDNLMPVGAAPPEIPETPSEVVLVLGTSSSDAATLVQIDASSEAWFDLNAQANVSPTVAIVPVATRTPAPEPEPAPEPVPPIDGDSEDADDTVLASPLQADDEEDDPATTSTTTAAPTTTTAAPTTTTVAPPVPLFATNGNELTAALGQITTTDGETRLADVSAALVVASQLLTSSVRISRASS